MSSCAGIAAGAGNSFCSPNPDTCRLQENASAFHNGQRMKIQPASSRIRQVIVFAALFALFFCQDAIPAQSAPQQTPPPQPQNQQQTSPNQQPSQPQDQPSPDAGGPTGDSGAIAIPKKKEKDEAPPPPPEPKVKNPEGLQNFSLRVDVPIVNVDVGVILEKTHQFVPNLQKDNFRVFEDGVPQDITSFQKIQAPITAVLLVEFAANSYAFIYDMRNAAYTFAEQLRPDDYIAVVTYDMHTQILTDFTGQAAGHGFTEFVDDSHLA